MFKLPKFLKVHHTIAEVAPPVSADKLSDLFAFIAIGHHGCTQIFVRWIEYHLYSKIYSEKNSRVQAWCPIELCRSKCGRAKSYMLLYKMWVSKCPSYAALLHKIAIPYALR